VDGYFFLFGDNQVETISGIMNIVIRLELIDNLKLLYIKFHSGTKI